LSSQYIVLAFYAVHLKAPIIEHWLYQT